MRALTTAQVLTEGQVAELARRAGVPEDKIALMVNVAKRESGLRPGAHNPNRSTGDNSYGLWQINMINEPGYRLGEERLRQFADIGVTAPEDLKDPWKNTQAMARILKSSGTGAWTTAAAAMKDPPPNISSSGSVQIGADELRSGVASNAYDAERTDMAASNPFLAAIEALSPQEKTSVASSGGGLSAGAASNAAGVLEYLTGDPSHAGFRDDHGGGNYHEHLAFDTPERARAAAALLNQHGIITTELKGVNRVGGHSPNSYHYSGQAFDVPGAQIPRGQEQGLSEKVRALLGLA
jgi:hypothetical protein